MLVGNLSTIYLKSFVFKNFLILVFIRENYIEKNYIKDTIVCQLDEGFWCSFVSWSSVQTKISFLVFMNSFYMIFKMSFLAKTFLTNGTLMWFEFFMDTFNVLSQVSML